MYDETDKCAVREDPGVLRAPLGGRVGRGLNTAVAREKSAIEAELSVESQLIELLHNSITTLEDKVATVRSQMPPTDEGRDERDQLGSSMFYHRVFEGNDGILVAVERLRRLTRELEV